jgi:L-serine dehydratase
MRRILPHVEAEGLTLWEYVFAHEGDEIEGFLEEVWRAMQAAVDRGLEEEGRLPGPLKLRRKASSFAMKSRNAEGFIKQISTLFSYALAVSEENAAGGTVVTAPTCGASGVLPAVLRTLRETYRFSDTRIIRALATAGLIGNTVKTNGSISGAEVGCQGEVGTACAMAAAATTHLLGGTPRQIEYAAEMGLEHHLGLTCDPVLGLVQVPCIERNAVAATRAVDAGTFATLSDGSHMISLDEVIDTMFQTGRDMASTYRETAEGGLARFYNRDELEAHARLGRTGGEDHPG